MSAHFSIVKRMSEGLYAIETGDHTAMWTLRKLRQSSKCVATERELLKGEQHYGPIGNMDYRGWRIHREYVERQPDQP